jgi:hypothetical protein
MSSHHQHTCDRNRPSNCLDLRSLKPARVRDEAHVNALARGQKPRHVLTPEAVPHAADSADVQVGLDVVNGESEDPVDLGGGVAEAPFGQVEGGAFAVVRGDSVASKEIGEDDGVACAGDGVGEAGWLSVSVLTGGGLETRWYTLSRQYATSASTDRSIESRTPYSLFSSSGTP